MGIIIFLKLDFVCYTETMIIILTGSIIDPGDYGT